MKILTSVVFLGLLNVFFVKAQINYSHNAIRPGDELIKQQVEYKDPGREGENVIWDFGRLKSINDQYTLNYSSPILIENSIYIMGGDTILAKNVKPDELIIGTEHYTMYYYRQKENRSEVLGHENPTTLLRYSNPLLVSPFPVNYKDTFQSSYRSEGIYSAKVPFATVGTIEGKADAYGVIILPSGDTLNHVLRIKTTQTIQEKISKANNQNDVLFNTIIERYKWYSKGYRYPIFETVRTINVQDTLEQTEFQTAFFFPPQEHLYLDNDKNNLAVLDSLWNMEHNSNIKDPIITPENTAKLSYNFYPNPVVSQLTLEYYLEKSTNVNVTIFSMEGRLVENIHIGYKDKGLHAEYIDCSLLPKGTYILRIEANNRYTSDKIIKK